MSRNLRDNLTSSYLEAAHSLYPKHQRHRTIAYVESYDDIAFWRSMLSEFEDDNHYFEVMLPSQDSLAKGKKTVLMNSLNTDQLGKGLIACVDSDYDFLLQGATRVSDTINSNKYIFQTYAYAIENYQCYADSLHEVCVQATLNDREVIDFKSFMERYSEIVYPLFLWCIWFYRQHDTGSFPMYDFNDCARLRGDVNVDHPEHSLNELSRQIDALLHRYHSHYPSLQPQIDKMGEELKKLGLEPKTTYLYIQGHHIMDNVVIKLLTPVCAQLRKERENDIKRLAEHEEQYHNEITCYDNSQSPIGLMLRKNIAFQSLFLYQWLKEDLNDLMNELKKDPLPN
jgi:hypothetical protein